MKAALELMNDNLTPAFITALPDGNQHGTLTLMAGFEGLSRVVEHQAEKCGQLFESAGLTLLGAEEYDLSNGCFRERFKTMANHPFTVKAAGTARSTPDVLQAVTKECKTADWLLDIGCGRVFAGLDTLDTPSWSVMNHAIRTAGGHIQLDKAPDAFKKENDIYGTSPRPEWDLMHTLKQALDPAGLFTPGGLPGRAAKTV